MDLRKDRSRLDHYLRPAATAPPAPVGKADPEPPSDGAAPAVQLPQSCSAPLPGRPEDAGAAETLREDSASCHNASSRFASCTSCELPAEQALLVQGGAAGHAPGPARPTGRQCGAGDLPEHPESRAQWSAGPGDSPDSWASEEGVADGPGCAGRSVLATWAADACKPRSCSGIGCACPEPHASAALGGAGVASAAPAPERASRGAGEARCCGGGPGAQPPADRGAASGQAHATAAHKGTSRGSGEPQLCNTRPGDQDLAGQCAVCSQAHAAAAHEGRGTGSGKLWLQGTVSGGGRSAATGPEPLQAHAGAAHCPSAGHAQEGAAAAQGADAVYLADVDLDEQQRLWAAIEARKALRAGARRCGAAQPVSDGGACAPEPAARAAAAPLRPCKRAEAPAGASCGGSKRRQLTLGSFFGAGVQR